MKKLLLSLSLSLISASSYGGAILKNPTNAPHGSSLPATCSAGNIFVNTSATTGQQWYVCESANSWVQQGGSGSVSPNLTPTTIKMGSVQVIHSSGTYDVYSPTNTTDGANGAALSRSFSSWTDKMEIRLGPGTFDMGENYLTLYTSTNSALIGAGKNLTKLKFSGAGYAIQPSSYCYLANFGFGESGAGIGGLTDVSGSHLIVDNVSVYGSQDGIALNGQFDTIDIYDSEIGTTFDAIAWSNTSSTATINVYNSKILSRGGSINAHGFECFGAGIVNSYNNYVEVKDAGTRVGYGNGSGLGSCRFNIYGGSVETYNGGTDISVGNGSVYVTNDVVYFSSKTTGTINYLNQNSTQATRAIKFADGTIQVSSPTISPGDNLGTHIATKTITSGFGILGTTIALTTPAGITFSVQDAGITGQLGGAPFQISSDDGSYINVTGATAQMYANTTALIQGESGVNVYSNGGTINLDPNQGGASGGTIIANALLRGTTGQFDYVRSTTTGLKGGWVDASSFTYVISGSTFQYNGTSVTATVPIIVKSTNNYPSVLLKDDNNRGRIELYSRLKHVTTTPAAIFIATDSVNASLNSLHVTPYASNTRFFFGSAAIPFYSVNMANVSNGFEGLTNLDVTSRLGHTFGRYIGGESGQQNHWQSYYGWVYKPNMGLSYTNAYSSVGSGLNQWGMLIAGQLDTATQFAIRGATSQTSPLQVWENVSGSTLAYVDNSGNLYTPSITGVSGSVSISSTAFTGGMGLFSRSLAQINSMAPSSEGISYYCTTCTQEAVCISTGTATGAFSSVADKTNPCN